MMEPMFSLASAYKISHTSHASHASESAKSSHPSHTSEHSATESHAHSSQASKRPASTEFRLLLFDLAVVGLILHEEGFGDELIERVRIALFVIEVHDLLLGVIAIDLLSLVHSFDQLQTTNWLILNGIRLDPPVYAFDLILDVALEVRKSASKIRLIQPI